MDKVERKEFDPAKFAEELRQLSRQHQKMLNDVHAFCGNPEDERELSSLPEADSQLIDAVVATLREHPEELGDVAKAVITFLQEVTNGDLKKQNDFWIGVALVASKPQKANIAEQISRVADGAAAAVQKTI